MMKQRQLHLNLVTQPSLQNKSFRATIAEKTDQPVRLIDSSACLQFHQSIQPSIMMFDYQLKWPIEVCKHFNSQDNVSGIVLLNVDPQTRASELARWQKLRAVFYTTDSLEHVCEGLRAISRGESWLSRKLCHDLLDYLQKRSPIEKSLHCDDMVLTRRERQVLKSLTSGGSNTDIAETLFVSEHTIKSHLYRIFRKIDAQNRSQAIMWAKENL